MFISFAIPLHTVVQFSIRNTMTGSIFFSHQICRLISFWPLSLLVYYFSIWLIFHIFSGALEISQIKLKKKNSLSKLQHLIKYTAIDLIKWNFAFCILHFTTAITYETDVINIYKTKKTHRHKLNHTYAKFQTFLSTIHILQYDHLVKIILTIQVKNIRLRFEEEKKTRNTNKRK